ncbi:BLOC-1-related complex subunit 8 isoform X1 [Bubalus kerabau]|uniref:BLOC-1-related complex subunit 8 isoform X1 n=2 Tax=Bubalus carabanensis TaxID=3119969 RepID=UPI00244E8FF4|nr:BLOC-1-related complex subunit 8 isoform X1 [Bubalus carabanensis]
MEEPEMQLKGKKVTDKFTESVYVLANEPSVALYRLQEHVRRSLPELAQHKADMQRWEEQSQGAIYTVEYACSAVKNLVDSSVYFRSVEGLLKQAISIRDHMNATAQGHSPRDLKLPDLHETQPQPLKWVAGPTFTKDTLKAQARSPGRLEHDPSVPSSLAQHASGPWTSAS